MPKTVKRRKNKLAGRYRNRWPDEAEISGRMIPKWVADSCRNRWPDHPEIRSEDNERLGQPKNAGISWYDRDIAILIKLHQQQIAVNDIAKQLERTSVAISAKLLSLELISELEHQNNMELYLRGS